MLQSYGRRVILVEGMDNRWNYEEYLTKDDSPLSLGSYIQKLGLLEGAKSKYPTLSPVDALKKFMVDVSASYEEEAKNDGNKPCGGCGGKGNERGKVK